MFSTFFVSLFFVLKSLLFWFIESHHHFLLNSRFSSFLFPLFSFLIEMARTKTTPNPPPSVDYKTLYCWAPNEILIETSKITSNKDVITYREGEADEKHRVFGREHNAYVSVRPCRKGEPVCVDDRTSLEEPFFFMYSTIFKRIKPRLPFTGFERALLTKVNMAPAQLGLREGLCHPLQPFRPHSLNGYLLVLLRGEESWQETVAEF